MYILKSKFTYETPRKEGYFLHKGIGLELLYVIESRTPTGQTKYVASNYNNREIETYLGQFAEIIIKE